MNSSKLAVRSRMRLIAEDFDSATALVECVADELDLPQHWLDDPDHWIWDFATEFFFD